ncbi:chromate efflux transporter [Gramella sp. AN32]|jgi:chromate transporter|uniref:Chromate efflux transporter n=1 Tax=Christiangramia antarctica TaxID=2058158 RepID=A0ABW5X1V2_9FLAO|nr:chromate efflux transporter [Gramella sp. AN32]MCM4156746.1 chromate transporter [Gramella sp. AN32]|tara:strand:- start:6902 stop:8269 length:1368 start_codon:yes stop_codon:yes gene_type:complete
MEQLPFKEAIKVWIRVAIYSFGGPAGQIAVMHKILVEEKKWISENRFLHALNYCMLLPGPEAQQLATYIGWLLHRTKGGLTAGILFVIPGFVSILILSILYAAYRDVGIVEAIFFGIKPAVLAIVVGAVIKIGKKAIKNEVMFVLAALAFIAIFFFEVDFPYIIVAAGLTGFIGGKFWEEKFHVIKGHYLAEGDKDKDNDENALIDSKIQPVRPSLKKTLKTIFIFLTLWSLPLLIIGLVIGVENIFFSEGLFFSKTAVVTFGGAYAVLAYIAQKAVEDYGWLQSGEMLDGLGMAETTPGPLIQVVQFVGFMGAYRLSGSLDPITAGILASLLVTWVTFIPCFLFIFTGAPYIEYLRGNKSLTTALSGITAAVVGVVLNLGVWFAIHTLFSEVNEKYLYGARWLIPEWSTVNIGSLIIALIASFVYFILKWDMLKTILISVLSGIIYFFIFKELG